MQGADVLELRAERPALAVPAQPGGRDVASAQLHATLVADAKEERDGDARLDAERRLAGRAGRARHDVEGAVAPPAAAPAGTVTCTGTRANRRGASVISSTAGSIQLPAVPAASAASGSTNAMLVAGSSEPTMPRGSSWRVRRAGWRLRMVTTHVKAVPARIGRSSPSTLGETMTAVFERDVRRVGAVRHGCRAGSGRASRERHGIPCLGGCHRRGRGSGRQRGRQDGEQRRGDEDRCGQRAHGATVPMKRRSEPPRREGRDVIHSWERDPHDRREFQQAAARRIDGGQGRPGARLASGLRGQPAAMPEAAVASAASRTRSTCRRLRPRPRPRIRTRSRTLRSRHSSWSTCTCGRS